MTFTVTYADRDGGGTRLRLAGELDLSTAPELNAAGGWLRVTGAGGRVDRVLQVTGLAEVLRYEPSRADPTARSTG